MLECFQIFLHQREGDRAFAGPRISSSDCSIASVADKNRMARTVFLTVSHGAGSRIWQRGARVARVGFDRVARVALSARAGTIHRSRAYSDDTAVTVYATVAGANANRNSTGRRAVERWWPSADTGPTGKTLRR